MAFNTNANERLRITSGGLVGIGTTSPAQLLDVQGGANRTPIAFRGTGTTSGYLYADNSSFAIKTSAGSVSGTDNLIGVDTGNFAFIYTNGSERARIDSSGRLLVGTSSDTGNSSVVIQGNAGASIGNAALQLRRGQTAPGGGLDLGIITFADSASNAGALISGIADANWTAGSSYPTRLVFSTTASGASSPTERMRIDNSGAVLINRTSFRSGVTNNCKLNVLSPGGDWAFDLENNNSTAGNCFGINITYTAVSPNNTGNSFINCTDLSATRAQIRSNGGLANFSANNVNLSDRNAKKDIAPADGTWDCLKKWEIVNFRYKDQPDDADLNMGVIAQQVVEHCPEIVQVFQEAKEATETEPAQEERIGVKEQQMMWMAIKALQEAQLRIETLEAEVAALKAR